MWYKNKAFDRYRWYDRARSAAIGKFVQMFQAVIQHICCILPLDMNIAEVHATANSKIQAFFRHLANFLTVF